MPYAPCSMAIDRTEAQRRLKNPEDDFHRGKGLGTFEVVDQVLGGWQSTTPNLFTRFSKDTGYRPEPLNKNVSSWVLGPPSPR
jgi:hypothetical protein